MTRPNALSCREVEEMAGLYAVGALDPAEADEVRAHLETHPDIHAQCLEVVSAATSLSTLAPPVEPPAELRGRVMQAVAGTQQDRPEPVSQQASPWTEARPDVRAVQPAIEVPQDTSRQRFAWSPSVRTFAVGTLAVLLTVVVGLGILAQRGAVTPSDQLVLLRDAIVAQARGEAQVVELVATDGGPGATGFAVLPPAQSGYIVLAGLPAASADQVWQAWYLSDGEPASAGLLDVGPQGVASLEGLDPTPSTSGIALTLEPAGGSDAPTSAPVVIGSLLEA